MATVIRESPPQTPADNDREKYLTAKELIGDIECEILLERDAFGQYQEVMLTPVGESDDRSF
jgi:hypothetical protein